MTLILDDIFKNTIFKKPQLVEWHGRNSGKVYSLSALTDSEYHDSEVITRDQIKISEPEQYGCLIMTEESSGGNCWGDDAHSHSVNVSDRLIAEFETILLNMDEMNLRISDYIRVKRSMKKIEDVYFSEYYGNGKTYDYYYFLVADINYALKSGKN
jgi:hypothetical protein